MPDPQDDRRYLELPPGFVVLRENKLDPDEGRGDRWGCRGIVSSRSVIRSGMWSAWVLDAVDLGQSAQVDCQELMRGVGRHDLLVVGHQDLIPDEDKRLGRI
ncbi:hypothetical protein ENSA5_64710 [Enhygromyxa salina]|uniref:Uncharacterized protein n=1 Tax=Enhygromyxa salina TaxID=215803 RepID=A0A2S9XC80_9BACT|nr:hypothetical protein [Enhygromyxa salina]PRP90457.1 hypothetical protein ENSA5_64710 [Enhygromyxa salina]